MQKLFAVFKDEPNNDVRETGGIRTHDHQSHNLALYQLSYSLHIAQTDGLEPSSSDHQPDVLSFTP